MLRFSTVLCSLLAAAPLLTFNCLAGHSLSKLEQPKSFNSRRPYVNSARSAYLRQLVNPERKLNLGVAYFVELRRGGHVYKTNHKTKFRSGDQIRFHVFANADAYIYIVMRQGSKGTKSVLFPLAATGTNNLVKRGQDCIVPTENALQFDETPGIENVGLLLSRKKLDSALVLHYPTNLTAYLTKRKLPPHTKLSVERANSAALLKSLPANKGGSSIDLIGKASGRQLWRTASATLRESNMVVVVSEGGVVAVDFPLVHEPLK